MGSKLRVISANWSLKFKSDEIESMGSKVNRKILVICWIGKAETESDFHLLKWRPLSGPTRCLMMWKNILKQQCFKMEQGAEINMEKTGDTKAIDRRLIDRWTLDKRIVGTLQEQTLGEQQRSNIQRGIAKCWWSHGRTGRRSRGTLDFVRMWSFLSINCVRYQGSQEERWWLWWKQHKECASPWYTASPASPLNQIWF